MSKLQVVCIPGLGLSSKFLSNLNIEYGEVRSLDWIAPKGWEPIKNYAFRICESLSDFEGEVVLIGHSFGGVMAQEIARLRPIRQIILVSSMQEPEEAPGRLKILGRYGLHRLISKELILLTFQFWARTHSFRTPELRRLFKDAVKSLSSHYFRWSLLRLATWPGSPETDTPILRIHGDKDVTFRLSKIQKVDQVITGGDHNMIYLRGDEISRIINDCLQKIVSD